jgi:hypothetical protein
MTWELFEGEYLNTRQAELMCKYTSKRQHLLSASTGIATSRLLRASRLKYRSSLLRTASGIRLAFGQYALFAVSRAPSTTNSFNGRGVYGYHSYGCVEHRGFSRIRTDFTSK